MQKHLIYRAFGAGLLVLLICVSPVLALPVVQDGPVTDTQILHLLNRATFGPAPGDIAAVRAMGIGGWLNQQLHPEHFLHNQLLDQRLGQLPTLNASMADLANQYDVPGEEEKAMSEEQRKEYERRRHSIVEELITAKILRSVMSPSQLQEVMTDFWFNHFNIFAEKGLDKTFIGSYERDAIRPYVLGRFRDLLGATAHHPAMIFYLDNAQNIDPASIQAQRAAQRGKEVGINENYAREVMELHTLGVNSGYSQKDVTTLAHILTGWGLSEGQGPAGKSAFYFDPRRHDFNSYNWLGYPIRGGGQEEIEHVLDILAANSATAHHIAYELAQYFVADEPPSGLVDRMAATYSSHDGDIAAVLLNMFQAKEFWDPQYVQKKFKPPFRFVISALRAANVVPPGDARVLQGALNQMGEPLYHCLTPNGYANTNDQWLNSDALLKRIDFDKRFANFLDANSAQTIFDALGNNWSQNTLATTQGADARLKPALLLASPEFVYY
jgi:uncharacterized protein (DUF1800 family)